MKYSIAAIFVFFVTSSRAQYFQFSQYDFTPQRINPARVASSNFALLNFVYRNQATDGGFHLTSNLLNVSYPLASRKGGRFGGIGVSLMDDRSGQAGIFRTQEASVSYGMKVDIASFQSISLGVRVLYQSRRLDLNGLYTGSQYIPDRGFDGSISPGENIGEVANNFLTFSAGLHWQKSNAQGLLIGYGDISFMDLNNPEDAFLTQFHLNPTFVGAVGFRIYRRANLSIFPEALYTRSASNNVLNAGARFRLDLNTAYDIERPHVDIVAKYIIGRSGLAGIQFHNERFSFGLSYDFPMVERNVANTSALEVGLTLKKLVIRNKRKVAPDKSARKAKKTTVSNENKSTAAERVKKPMQPIQEASNVLPVTTEQDVTDQPKQIADSVAVNANAGKVDHDPLALEKATLYFNFKFKSASLDGDAAEYLNGLAVLLRNNPNLTIKLVGHTDNVGSEKFNMDLSVQRAQSMKKYLVQQGVVAARVSVDGKGLSNPLHENHTPQGRAKNRRVELTILYVR